MVMALVGAACVTWHAALAHAGSLVADDSGAIVGLMVALGLVLWFAETIGARIENGLRAEAVRLLRAKHPPSAP